jgi:hypothetical protein
MLTAHLHSNRTMSDDKCIRGVALLNNKVYVGLRSEPVIKVYDTSTFNLHKNLTVPGLRCVSDMASCPECDVIYLADGCNRMIHVIDETGPRVHWPVADKPDGLSVNSHMNVIVTFREIGKLQEFTVSGGLVREITLQRDIVKPLHAIQLDEDRLAVVHGWNPSEQHRVCIVSNNGTILQSYGGSKGIGNDQLYRPIRMLITGDSMIVADYANYRLLLFKVSPLTYIRKLVSTRSESLQPWGTAITDNATLLYVSFCRQMRTYNIVWSH